MATCEVWDPELGCWQIETLPTPGDFKPVPPDSVGALPTFDVYYGIRITSIGEDGDAYLALGHADPRAFLAAAQRWARVNYVQRYRDWRWLKVEYLWAAFTALPDNAYSWQADYVGPDVPGAVPVMVITGLEGLEDYRRPSRCPMCRRVRATGREFHNKQPWHPEKPETWVHECPCSSALVGHTWPTEQHTTKEI